MTRAIISDEALIVASLIPWIGIPADFELARRDFVAGRHADAAFGILSAIPVVGDAAGAVRLLLRVGRLAGRSYDVMQLVAVVAALAPDARRKLQMFARAQPPPADPPPWAGLTGPDAAHVAAAGLLTLGYDAESTTLALATAKAESGWNPNATSPPNPGGVGRDRGFWQLNDKWHNIPRPELDPYDLIQSTLYVGREMLGKGRGLKNWTCYREGLYKPHVHTARDAVESALKENDL